MQVFLEAEEDKRNMSHGDTKSTEFFNAVLWGKK